MEEPKNVGGHEFSESDSQLIGELARKMSGVGFFTLFIGVLYLLLFVLAVLQLLGGHHQDIAVLIALGLAAMILLSLGVWTRRAAAAFEQIVATKGNDLRHLMNALGNLRNVYALVYTLILLYLVLVIVALVVAMIIVWGYRV